MAYYLTFSVGHTFRQGLAELFAKDLRKLQTSCQLGLCIQLRLEALYQAYVGVGRF